MIELSVIMPVYNEKKQWVEKSIKSILNQTYKEFEFIIILDNPGNEELEKIILEFSKLDNRIIFFKNEKNIGLVNTLNRGLDVASGKYIARMDADDISEEDRLLQQITFLKNNNNIDLVGTNWICIDENDNILFKHDILPEHSEFINKNIKYNNMFLHPSWMFKSEIIDIIGGYRNIEFAEDYDFITRLITSNLKITNLNKYLMKYRVRNNSISVSKSYEQYLNSKKIISYMNERKKYNKDKYDGVKKINDRKFEIYKKNYMKATEYFIKSRKYLNERHYKMFLITFVKSFIKSKYRFNKNINIILYNIKLYLYIRNNKLRSNI